MNQDLNAICEMAYALGEISRDERDYLASLDAAAMLMRLLAASPASSARETSLQQLLQTHRAAVQASRSGPRIADGEPAPDTQVEGKRAPSVSRTPEAPPTEAAGPVPPSGRYHYLFPKKKPLGKGGMGEVVEFKDGHLLRTGALKFLLPAKRPEGWSDLQLEALDRDRAARFRYEGLITAYLEHPNILPVTDIGELDGVPFIAEKLNRGQTLRQLLDGKALKDRLAYLRCLEPIALAMAFAHHQGVLHRDLKGPNVMVGSHGEVQVTDWGAAKILPGATLPFEPPPPTQLGTVEGPIGAPGLTQNDVAFGTVGCTSPEQASSLTLGPQTDIFSFGIILWEILTGRVAATEAAAAKKAPGSKPKFLYEPMPEVTTLEPKAPAKWVSIQRKCTQPKPEDRYASFAELLKDLQGAAVGGPVTAHKVSVPEWLGDQLAKNRASLALALVAAILIAGVSAAGWAGKAGEAQRAEAAERATSDTNEILKGANDSLKAANAKLEREQELNAVEHAKVARVMKAAEGDLFDQLKVKQGASKALAAILHLREVAESGGPAPSALELDANDQHQHALIDFQQGRTDQARSEYAQCVQLLSALEEHGPLDGELSTLRSQCLLGLGDVQALKGDAPGAVVQMSLALDVAEKATPTAANEGQRVGLVVVTSLIESRIADVLLGEGDVAGARLQAEASRDAVAPLQKSSDPWSRDQGQKRTAVAELYLGLEELAEGNPAAAHTDIQQALDIDQRRQKLHHDQAREATDVVEDLVGLAQADIAQGHPEDARTRLTQAETLIEASIKEDPKRVEWLFYATKVEEAFAKAWPPASAEAKAHSQKLQQWAKAMLDADASDTRGMRAMKVALGGKPG